MTASASSKSLFDGAREFLSAGDVPVPPDVVAGALSAAASGRIRSMSARA